MRLLSMFMLVLMFFPDFEHDVDDDVDVDVEDDVDVDNVKARA